MKWSNLRIGLPISEALPGMMSDAAAGYPDPGEQSLDFELMAPALGGRPFGVSHFTPETFEINWDVLLFLDSFLVQLTWYLEPLWWSGQVLDPRPPSSIQSWGTTMVLCFKWQKRWLGLLCYLMSTVFVPFRCYHTRITKSPRTVGIPGKPFDFPSADI